MNARTDNLYKCCAISGIVISLFALYVPYRFADDVVNRSAKLEIETRRAEIEANHLSQETEQLSKTLDPQTPLEPGTKSLNAADRKIATQNLDEGRLKLNIKYAEIKAANHELDRMGTQTIGIMIVGLVLLVGGVFLANYGFRNWYDKIQAVNDFVLQHELDRLAQDKLTKK